MRRSVKVAALASAAALLAIGASMTSFAKGWTQEDGEWVWLDSDGERVTEEFKLSGSKYYWLNEDGVLGSDELVEYKDNHYYVDETGAMVTNQWMELENDDEDDGFEDTVWYYFQSSGKAYKSGKKDINGKSYVFNENGKMLFGWIQNNNGDWSMDTSDDDESSFWEDADYYAGDANDGALVKSAWKQIRVYVHEPFNAKEDAENSDYDYWFYFSSNGKKKKDTENTTTINGKKYRFAEHGEMVYEWDEASDAASDAKYFGTEDDGSLKKKGWFKVVPSEGIDSKNAESGNNEAKWFYADNSGNLYYAAIKTINGKKYLFNKAGECKAGLWYIWFGDDDKITDLEEIDSETLLDKYTTDLLETGIDIDDETAEDAVSEKDGVYYFATPLNTDAAMKTGSCTVEVDGDNYAFKFKTSGIKGQGITKLDGSSYYVNGRKIKADSDQKYQIYECYYTGSGKDLVLLSDAINASKVVNYEENTQFAVISSTGTIVKSGTKKDGDDLKLSVSGYLLQKVTTTGDNKYDIWKYTGAED
jgi:glucan-binding YG repeat protein